MSWHVYPRIPSNGCNNSQLMKFSLPLTNFERCEEGSNEHFLTPLELYFWTWRHVNTLCLPPSRLCSTVLKLRSFIIFLDISLEFVPMVSLQWRHKGSDGVSNHQLHDCLLNCLIWRRSKETSRLRVTGLSGNSPMTVEFPAQMASNAENVSIWWRHHTKATSRYLIQCWTTLMAHLCVIPAAWMS